MASKCSGGRELTQLMADHVLGHIGIVALTAALAGSLIYIGLELYNYFA